MSPTLDDGDFVLVVALGGNPPRVGEVVVADVPGVGRVVKRVSAIDAHQRVQLAGDNGLSMTSEHLGTVALSAIVGRSWLRIGRRGVLTRRGLRAPLQA